jgi:hypothetical protein
VDSDDYLNRQLVVLTKYSMKIHDFIFWHPKVASPESNNFIFLLLSFNKNSSFIESNFNIFFKAKNKQHYNIYKTKFIYQFGNLLDIRNITAKNKRNSFQKQKLNRNFNLFKKSKGDNSLISRKSFKSFNFTISKIEILMFLFFKPILLKLFSSQVNFFRKKTFFKSISGLLKLKKNDLFKSDHNQAYLNNLFPNTNLIYILKKKIIRTFAYLRFDNTPTP